MQEKCKKFTSEEEESAFVDSFFRPGGILDPGDEGTPPPPFLLPSLPSVRGDPWSQKEVSNILVLHSEATLPWSKQNNGSTFEFRQAPRTLSDDVFPLREFSAHDPPGSDTIPPEPGVLELVAALVDDDDDPTMPEFVGSDIVSNITLNENHVVDEEVKIDSSSVRKDEVHQSIASVAKDEIHQSITSVSKDEVRKTITSVSKDKVHETITSVPKDKVHETIALVSKDEIQQTITSVSSDEVHRTITSEPAKSSEATTVEFVPELATTMPVSLPKSPWKAAPKHRRARDLQSKSTESARVDEINDFCRTTASNDGCISSGKSTLEELSAICSDRPLETEPASDSLAANGNDFQEATILCQPIVDDEADFSVPSELETSADLKYRRGKRQDTKRTKISCEIRPPQKESRQSQISTSMERLEEKLMWWKATAFRPLSQIVSVLNVIYAVVSPLLRLVALATGTVLANLTKFLLVLALAIRNIFSYAAAECTRRDGPCPCYVVLYFTPTVCDWMMKYVSLPHFAPHILSNVAMYCLCESSLKTAHTGAKKLPDDFCCLVLRVIRFYFPLSFILEGFSNPKASTMLLSGSTRLLLAYVLSMLREGHIFSPVGWVGWSVQLLLSSFFQEGLIERLMICVLGLALIRLMSILPVETAMLNRI